MARRAQQEQSAADMVADKQDRLGAMASVAEQFKSKGWRPARETLKRVQAVPTIFPDFDYRVKVGGLPIARITTVHGPSNHGKTLSVLGFIRSFLARDHFAAYVDAEMTTPIDWCEKMMGPLANHPGFVAVRPRSYEETDDQVRHFCNTVGEARAKGRVPQDTTGLVVVDSIKKLVPDRLFKLLMRDAEAKTGKDSRKVGLDGMGGRAGQYKAALNSQWLDELVVLLHETNTALVLIAREYDDEMADQRDRQFGNNWKVAGGKSLIFDASLAIRVTRQSWLYQGSDQNKQVIGERHRMLVHKTKVAGKQDREIECHFHSSNGALVPEGFDTARDLLEVALEFQMIRRDGSWLTWGKRRFNGDVQFVQKLTADPEALAELDAQVRAGFGIEDDPMSEEKEAEPPVRARRKAGAK